MPYNLSAAETRRIKALTPGVTFGREPLSDVPDEPGPRAAAIIDLLLAVMSHDRLVELALY